MAKSCGGTRNYSGNKSTYEKRKKKPKDFAEL